MLEAHTFGGSPAAETLVKMLQDHHVSVTHKVSRWFGKFNRGLHEIEKIEDHEIRTSVRNLWRNKFIATVVESNLPEDVKKFLRNIMIKNFRDISNASPKRS